MSTRKAGDRGHRPETTAAEVSRDAGDESDPRSGRPVTERVLTPDTGGDEFDDLVDLLDDGYTRRILSMLDRSKRPARELIEGCDASRATVYRRLNRLQDHGLVKVGLECHNGGHHRKVYESTLERAAVELRDGTPLVRLYVVSNDD